ncbi:hypothetical protein [Sphingomonas sp.]|uniref:hypothetical protein n=1 Tax=Sphingomonas sp. TaxID=28214 RepID=UPI0031DC4E05
MAIHDARDQPPVHHLAAADGIWRTLRPMVLKAMADIHAVKGVEEPEWVPSPNPFAPVDILPADRDALYTGLISAGHPATYARHMAYDMPDSDGGLQMLARHRLAHVSPALDHAYTYHRINELMEEGGFWKPCTGCQESTDGYVSTTDYPYDPLFRCQPGSGCHECGGIGVLWDDGRGYAAMTWDEVSDLTTDEVAPVEPTELACAALDFVQDVQNVLLSKDANLLIFPMASLDRLLPLLRPQQHEGGAA